jgi:2-succinyl-5-enolpyruvyl-6-hydroxy-3-cyclohexene-1-carboxylate synthase
VIREIDSQKTLSETFWEKFTEEWNKTEQKMLLIGRGNFEGKISRFCQKMNFVKIADAPANLKDENCIKNHDIFLSEKRHDLRPEILITFGGDVLSKKLKNFIRKNPPRAHYHLAPAGAVPDTFGTLTDILRVEPEYFFGQLFKRQACSLSNTFQKKWKDEDENAAVKKATIFGEKKWSEWGAMNEIFKNIPENVHLHLGNSMPVRYANVFDWAKKNIKIWSNRGTSGIDGCASTAVGHALLDSDKLHFLFIGDVSFFYDRNAFWHNDLPKNLKIIVFNNFGGGIFKMIDGPKNWQECDEFFVTHQSKTAQKTAEDYHFDYFSGENFEEMSVAFQNLLASKKTALMEIFTDKSQNSAVYDKIMKN